MTDFKSLGTKLRFFRQFTQNLRNIGALFPSSRALALEMAKEISVRATPIRVLEVGPGPGTITVAIVERLRPQDTLWLVEINHEFCQALRERFVENRKADWPKIHVFEGPLQSFENEAFDFVVSSLPFNAFSPELVQDLWHSLRSQVRPGGTLTFFEYWGVRGLRYFWPGPGERNRMAKVGKLFKTMIGPAISSTIIVMANLPPAKVHRVQF